MAQEETILVVEDEPGIARLVGYHLQKAGFGVDFAITGTEALRKVRTSEYVLVVLDLMLPEMDGLEFCRIVRSDRVLASLPIIMLTARDGEPERVYGLELGADDYITKPFSPKELVARVKAVLRRTRPALVKVQKEERVLIRGPFRLELDKYKLYKDQREVILSPREFSLLYRLVRTPGRVFSRGMLLDYVWGQQSEVDPRTVDVHIRRLREKIEDDPSRPRYILTKRGIGYYFSEG